MGAELTAAPPARRKALLQMLGKHQLASALATFVDFSIMVLCVQLLSAPAALGAVVGASAGAALNFQLGRRWTFAATGGAVGPQAARYALVSAASAALNGLGEAALHDGAGVQYVAARAIVALVVNLAWNLPMQRHFVFGSGGQRR